MVGKYDSRISYGQDGVQVVWDRIIFPDASSVDINGMVGLTRAGILGCATTWSITTSGCSASRPRPALFLRSVRLLSAKPQS
jgi:hypothetical protein